MERGVMLQLAHEEPGLDPRDETDAHRHGVRSLAFCGTDCLSGGLLEMPSRTASQ